MVTQEQIAGAFTDLREIRIVAQKIAALLEQARGPAQAELDGRAAGDAIPGFLNRLQERLGASGDRASDTPE